MYSLFSLGRRDDCRIAENKKKILAILLRRLLCKESLSLQKRMIAGARHNCPFKHNFTVRPLPKYGQSNKADRVGHFAPLQPDMIQVAPSRKLQ
jgi:hypothetical protein